MEETLNRLRAIRDAEAERIPLVIRAREEGAEWAELEEATGQTRQALNYAVKRANEGKLPEGNPRFGRGA